jgi:hypothetical protein
VYKDKLSAYKLQKGLNCEVLIHLEDFFQFSLRLEKVWLGADLCRERNDVTSQYGNDILLWYELEKECLYIFT